MPDGSLYVEEAMLLVTAMGAIAGTPILIEFLVERRKRKERTALSLEDVDVSSLRPRLAGLDELLDSIADLIDRARNPEAYASLKVGNEILILGPLLSGKKSLAHVIAQRADFRRLITVYNSLNPDALAKAKGLVSQAGHEKVMLLIPGIDLAFAKEDEEITAELEALIETTSEFPNVLVIGTATRLEPNSPLDNLFGIKLMVPGSARPVLEKVAHFYLGEAHAAGCVLEGLSPADFENRILQSATNAAEIEDIVTLCRTAALHRRRINQTPNLVITRHMLEMAVGRVIVGKVE